MLHVIGTDDLDHASVDARAHNAGKAAQRGPEVAVAYLTAALTKASASFTGIVDEAWVQPGEETWILDLTPWVGDRAMASLGLMGTSNSKYGNLRHVFEDPSYKRRGQGVSFSRARVSDEVAVQWMNQSRVLYSEVQDTGGQLTKVANHPLDTPAARGERLEGGARGL